MKTTRQIILCILALWLSVGLTAKGYGMEAPDPVNYRLKWIFNTSVAGDLYAGDHNMFSRQGLNVVVKPGGPERDAIKELELGRSQFGVASADQIIRALSKGARVIVVAQLFQINPLQWMYRPNKMSPLKPSDLKGKIVGVTYGGIDENIMRALLAKYHIEEEDLSLYSVRYDFTPFYQKKVDLWPIYRNAQGPIIGGKLKQAGEVVDYFNPDAHGIHTVANSVITSDDFLRHHPEMVDRFVTALLNGWELAMDPQNTEETIRTIVKFDKDTDIDIIREQLILTRQFIKPSSDIKIGRIDVNAWKQTEQMMLNQKLIEQPILIETYLKQID